jgi:demethylmenaquinone methyltransferase/2-methoxy-6-polyprenyl-1,4-benzoquinol methylase
VEELDKSPAKIRGMFGRIALRYDLLNHVLSFNSDRRWRKRAAAAVEGAPGRVLDLACGTGDLLAEISDGTRRAVGADFCVDMLVVARRKLEGRAMSLAAADALALPFPDSSFGAVTIAFGVRNFSDLARGLSEIRRVLRPGGSLCVLEFSRPPGLWGAITRLHSRLVVPTLGGALSGDRDAYRYLNRSVRAWPDRSRFETTLREAGYRDVRSHPLGLGLVALHRAVRP